MEVTVVIKQPGCDKEITRQSFSEWSPATEFVKTQIQAWPDYYHFNYNVLLSPEVWHYYNPGYQDNKANPKTFLWLSCDSTTATFSDQPVRRLDSFNETASPALAGFIYVASTLANYSRDFYLVGCYQDRPELLYQSFRFGDDYPLILYMRLSNDIETDKTAIMTRLQNCRICETDWVHIDIDNIIMTVTNYFITKAAMKK